MGKLKGNGRLASRQHRGRQPVGKARAAEPKPDSRLGFPTVSLEELARLQGIKPLTDLDALGSLWPDEFDPDEFAAWLSSERTARRQLAGRTKRESA